MIVLEVLDKSLLNPSPKVRNKGRMNQFVGSENSSVEGIRVGEILHRAYVERVARNGAYSHRAFARDLALSHSHLIRVLHGRRRMSYQLGLQVCEKLHWTGKDRALFLESVNASLRESPAQDRSGRRQRVVDLEKFRIMSEWYGPALWTLLSTPSCPSDSRRLASRLGIRTRDVDRMLERMQRAGLIESQDGKWVKADEFLSIPEKYADETLYRYHTQVIQKALEALEAPFKGRRVQRDITSATFTVDPRKLEKAKAKIAKFRRELMGFLTSSRGNSVFQLNLQFFELTRPGEPE